MLLAANEPLVFSSPWILRRVADGTATEVMNPAPEAGVCVGCLAKRRLCRKLEPGLGEAVSPITPGLCRRCGGTRHPEPARALHPSAPTTKWRRGRVGE